MSALEAAELEAYEVRLHQVEEALRADPANEDLKMLQREIRNLINISKAEANPVPSTSAQPISSVGEAATSKLEDKMTVGSEILAKYEKDGKFYPARIISSSGAGSNILYTVQYKGYDTTTTLDRSALKVMPPGYVAKEKLVSAKRNHAAGIALTPEEEKEKARKKKKLERKMEVKQVKTKEQAGKQHAWQSFAQKAGKKGIMIAGTAGNSIFATPDNPYGRVGVVGSGRGMTSFASRGKFKFGEAADEDGNNPDESHH